MMITPESLQRYLERRLDAPFALRLNENIRSIVTVSRPRNGGPVRASVHRMFLAAPADVLKSLAQFIKRPTPASRRAIGEFIREAAPPPPALERAAAPNRRARAGESQRAAARREPPPQSAGRGYDLEKIAQRLNRRHFGGRLRFQITWSRQPKPRGGARRGARSLQLGLCLRDRELIRVHPVLDSHRIPLYFLEYIIYHELCHLAVPARRDSAGRTLHHSREFYEMERRVPHYDEAARWLKSHLDALLRQWSQRPAEREARQLTLF